VARQQIHHHAFVGRIEMLHQDVGRAGLGGERGHKLLARVEAARRRTNSNDRELGGRIVRVSCR
jgi:hypothetical protein